MPDITVTVQDTPIQVTVQETPIQVTVQEGTSIGSSIPINTGLFYPASNPSGFITAAQGGGVLTINGLSGILTLTGLGDNTITLNGNTLQISGAGGGGNTGNFASVDVANIFTQNNLFNNGIRISGASAIQFVQTGANNYSSQIIDGSSRKVLEVGRTLGGVAIRTLSDDSGNAAVSFSQVSRTLVDRSGITAIDFNSRFISGDWYTNTTQSNSYSLINVGYVSGISGVLSNGLYQSGANLITTINSLSGNIAMTGSTLYNLVNNLSGVFNSSGSQYQAQIVVLTSNYTALSGNVGATGNALYNDITGFSGVFNTTGINHQIQFASLSGNVGTTGSILYNYINNFSGVFNNTGSQLQSSINSLSGNVINTGINLGTKIDSLSGFVRNTAINVTGFGNFTGIIGLSGLGSVTVFTGINNSILISGSASAVASSNSDGINLSGNLTTTGQTLYNYITTVSGNLDTRLYSTGQTILGLINAASAGVSSFNGASGILNLTGRGNVTVISGGIGLIQVSGDTGAYANFYPFANPNNYATSGNVQSTGSTLDSKINVLSGYTYPFVNPNNYATSGNLQSTGSTVDTKINALSGFVRNTSISVTGFTAYTGAIGLSGLGIITVFTGINNSILISGTLNNGDGINLSGNLTTTGQTLYGYITTASGNLDTRVFQTGSNLYNLINNFSGVFKTSGTLWQNQLNLITSNSTSTGIQLIGIINSLSGFVSNTSISVTGFTPYTGAIGLSGLGSVTIFTGINNSILISGSSAASSNNGDGINLSGNLTTTGQTLYNYITTTSGNLDTRIFQTGSNLYNLINNFSGVFNSSGSQYQSQINTLTTNLTTTGVNLGAKIDSLSGFVRNTSVSVTGFTAFTGAIGLSGIGEVTVFTGINNSILISGRNNVGDGINLSGNLTTTGQTLYGYITSTSGNFDTRVAQTGSNLYNLINNFSGVFNSSGTQYQNQINTLTTNLTTTGVNLGSKIDSLSGFVNNTPRVSAINVTGFGNQTGIINLSGLGSITTFTGAGNFIYISGAASVAAQGGGGAAVTGISVTGSTYFSGINGQVTITGADTVSVFLNGLNGITISGASAGNQFYPLNSNPSGYLVNGGTGFITGTLTGIGLLEFDLNAGQVAAFNMPVSGGANPSGQANSYSFNFNGTSVAKVYTESFTGLVNSVVTTGLQNSSLIIDQGLNLNVSRGQTAITLDTKPFYVFTGNANTIWTLPALSTCTGRIYFLKNRGLGNLTISGVANNTIFTTGVVTSFNILSGQAFIVANAVEYWEAM